MSARLATALVFVTSFCVLVLEILAGRLLAPLIGVSLETFTGIIGTVLAGIAAGNAVGGRLADRYDPAPLIGPTLLLGGALAWLAPVLISAVGAPQSPAPANIVFLAAISFFAPAGVLSAVTPLAAKLQLDDLRDTGRIVGNLSAAGTLGALGGTFLTGFVLVAAFPTRGLIFGVGIGLAVIGAVLTGWTRLARNGVAVVIVGAIGLGALLLPSPCDAETDYACIELEADDSRSSGLSLYLNGVRNSYVDLEDPTYLEFRYMRLFADVTAALEPGPVDALHLGGAGFTFPRYLNTVRPDSTGLVLEIDEQLVDFSREHLALRTSDDLRVVVGDARLSIADIADDSFDVVIGDAFSGLTVPWHLTTTQFVAEIDRVLEPDGVVTANLIDGGDLGFVRAEMATYRQRFEYVSVIVPAGGLDLDQPRNLLMIASHQPVEGIDVEPADGQLLSYEATEALIGDADVLDDDFAPVDQLRMAR